MKMTLEIAWAAGFIEGEGDIQASPTHLAIRAAQVQLQPLERLQSIFGGKIYPKKSKKPNEQDAYAWSLYGYHGIACIMTLYCLMSPKRQERMRQAIALWKTRKGRGSFEKAKTPCPLGHPYTPENTRISAQGWRDCLICARAEDTIRNPSRAAYKKEWAKRKAEMEATQGAIKLRLSLLTIS